MLLCFVSFFSVAKMHFAAAPIHSTTLTSLLSEVVLRRPPSTWHNTLTLAKAPHRTCLNKKIFLTWCQQALRLSFCAILSSETKYTDSILSESLSTIQRPSPFPQPASAQQSRRGWRVWHFPPLWTPRRQQHGPRWAVTLSCRQNTAASPQPRGFAAGQTVDNQD